MFLPRFLIVGSRGFALHVFITFLPFYITTLLLIPLLTRARRRNPLFVLVSTVLVMKYENAP